MGKALKICHVLASYKEIGGLEKNVIELASQQAVQGNDVSVLTTGQYLDKFGSGVKTINARLQRSRKDPRLKWSLKKEIRNLAPDVVHAHANKPGSIVGKLKLDCKKVATVHNLKTNQEVFTPFDKVICVSQMVADSLPRKDGHVIWNAVATCNPNHQKLGEALNPLFLDEGKPIFYAAARFVEAKGFDLLLEAFARTKGCYLWLIGDGKDKDSLEGIIAKQGIGDRVWRPGFLSPQEVLGLMLLADCFVISSRNEGGPYTLAEALRAKCSVIATKVGYAPEFLSSKQLIGETTVDSIHQKLEDYLTDPVGYKSHMGSVFEVADQELDLERMVKKVEKVYRSALES